MNAFKSHFARAAAGLMLGAACVARAGVAEGWTREQVTAELGPPTGSIAMSGREVLYFERGTVEFRNGRVARADLVTAEEARQRREAEARAYQAWLRAESERSARRKAEGERELQRMLGDPQFLLEDPERQVAVWQDFMRRYPEVPAGVHLLEAQRRAEEARERRETEERLSRLEWMAVESQSRARAAEEEAQRLRSQTSRTYVLGWPAPYYHYQRRPYDVRVRNRRDDAGGSSARGPTSRFEAWPYDFGAKSMYRSGSDACDSRLDSRSGGVSVNIGF